MSGKPRALQSKSLGVLTKKELFTVSQDKVELVAQEAAWTGARRWALAGLTTTQVRVILRGLALIGSSVYRDELARDLLAAIPAKELAT